MFQLQQAERQRVDDYLLRLRDCLADLPYDARDALVARTRAEIEVDIDVAGHSLPTEDAVSEALRRLGTPEACAARLRAQIAPESGPPIEEPAQTVRGMLTPCRACGNEVSRDAHMCPKCGAPFPGRTVGNISGYEWKSKTTVLGWPLVHVAFGRDRNGKLRVAKGVIAIGQFGIGAITIAQFGIGFLAGLGQFMLAPFAVAQFAAGLLAIGQFAVGLYALGLFGVGLKGAGPFVLRLLGSGK